MKHIDEKNIFQLLASAGNAPDAVIERILAKSKSLQRLSLEETAQLLCVKGAKLEKKIFDAAKYVKNTIYGKRIVLFAPLYISNFCANGCLYCSFRADNKQIHRKALTAKEIKQQVTWLLKRGHKRILLVAGEAAPPGKKSVDYYVDAIKAVYSVKVGKGYIRRVNINCAPLEVEELKKLKSAGIGTFQIFQETYHDETYHFVHPRGPKSDPDNRLDAIDRAFKAGIDDVGIGVLYGLYDFRFETLALLSHIEYLEKTFGVGPHTISVPRIEPAIGSDYSTHAPYVVSDKNFKKLVAVLRLAVPYTGIIMSTRETAEMRDELFSLGVSQVSAESRTEPGGYADSKKKYLAGAQFQLSDHRSLDEIVGTLLTQGFIPSFCAACYRKSRTGLAFMKLAKPGNIKDKCTINALLTLKEYLDDYASGDVRAKGYQFIENVTKVMPKPEKDMIVKHLYLVAKGKRDLYV